MKQITKLLQEEIDRIAEELYGNDKCKPIYIVSIYNRSLILTCKHNSYSFSDIIFPEPDMSYGTGLLHDIVSGLYARTM